MIELFAVFFKIGLFTFGGGYAMLPILQKEIVERRNWVTDQELADYFAIGQSTPGIIAVNTATFIGLRQKGIQGGVVATLGVITPSVGIILGIATFLEEYAHILQVQQAFAAMKVCVIALMILAVYKLSKAAIVDKTTFAIAFLVTLSILFVPFLSPAVFVILSGFLGIFLSGRRRKR